jgi:16S rRNA (cytosine1402-N4)-methyltransferase
LSESPLQENQQPARPKRRPRYRGANPRRFEEKYKELNPSQYPETIAKVLASGKTPAGAHRPIMVAEVLEALSPKPGDIAVDATLGYGGHARELLTRITPGGRLIGFDVDALELPKTEARLREAGFGEDVFTTVHSNFAGIQKVLAGLNIDGVDLILADLGVSSMQFDRPERGFSFKHEGPLDMRLNQNRGEPASALLARITTEKLSGLLVQNSDEPRAELLSRALTAKRGSIQTTGQLRDAIRSALATVARDEIDATVRRVFQALRIAVNEELSALEAFLRFLPGCLKSKGRVAILTFHSGEDRRVKKAFKEYHAAGIFLEISEDVIRPSREEMHTNPRSTPAKLRWAIRA